MATAYIRTDNPQKGIDLLLSAEKRTSISKTDRELNSIYNLFAEGYAKLGDFKKAYEYHIKFSEVEREHSRRNVTEKLAEMEAKFENS